MTSFSIPILRYISLPIFLLSFAIGLALVYAIGPEEKIIHIYPTPENTNKILFRDNAEQCFHFQLAETKCPINPLAIARIPVQ